MPRPTVHACVVCADPTAGTECSLPPCGGALGMGVAAANAFDGSAASMGTSESYPRANRSGRSCGTPLPDPPPHGGTERKALGRAVSGAALSRCAPEAQFFRRYTKGRMGCRNDQAAPREMFLHQTGKQALPGGIERV